MTYYSYKKYFLIGKPNLTKTYLFPSAQKTQLLYRNPCICQDWDKKNFIFFCTYSIKSLLIFKVQNSLLLLTFSLLPIEEASSFFTTGFLYYSFCLLHCISDKVLTLKHNLYIFVVVNEHLINYVGKYISVILFQHTILG